MGTVRYRLLKDAKRVFEVADTSTQVLNPVVKLFGVGEDESSERSVHQLGAYYDPLTGFLYLRHP